MILLQNVKAFGIILFVTWCYYTNSLKNRKEKFSLNKGSYVYSYLYLALYLQVSWADVYFDAYHFSLYPN